MEFPTVEQFRVKVHREQKSKKEFLGENKRKV